MTQELHPVSEEDLHGFVDGRLTEERSQRVERYLSEHPDAAAHLRGWKADSAALRASLDWKAHEAVPSALSVSRLAQARLARRWSPRSAAAGMGLALLVGTGSGWFLHGSMAVSGVTAVGLEAAAAYQVFAASTIEPAEFGPTKLTQLAAWTKREFGHAIKAPDLLNAGYQLLGGRMVSSVAGAGCIFFYTNGEGDRLTLLVRAMRQPDAAAPMQPVQTKAAAGYAWARSGFGFSLVSGKSSPALHELSDRVQAEFEART